MCIRDRNTAGENAQKQMKELQTRLIISLVFTIPLFYLSMGPMVGLPIPAFLDGDMNRLVNTITQMLLTLSLIHIWLLPKTKDSIFHVGSVSFKQNHKAEKKPTFRWLFLMYLILSLIHI